MSAQIVDHVVGNGGFAVGLTGTPLGAGIAGRWDAMVSGPTTYELAKLGYAVVPELIQRWRPACSRAFGRFVPWQSVERCFRSGSSCGFPGGWS